jgi:hypothetical protein
MSTQNNILEYLFHNHSDLLRTVFPGINQRKNIIVANGKELSQTVEKNMCKILWKEKAKEEKNIKYELQSYIVECSTNI